MLNWTTSDFKDPREIDSSTISSFTKKRTRILVSEPGYSYNWWPDIQKRLEHLLCLESGWDGYQGEPVSLSNASFALKVLESICTNDTPPPQIVPGTGGDLQIEWHSNATEIELHIIAPNNVEAWICSSETGEDGKELFLTNNFIEVANILRKMMEHSFDKTAAA